MLTHLWTFIHHLLLLVLFNRVFFFVTIFEVFWWLLWIFCSSDTDNGSAIIIPSWRPSWIIDIIYSHARVKWHRDVSEEEIDVKCNVMERECKTVNVPLKPSDDKCVLVTRGVKAFSTRLKNVHIFKRLKTLYPSLCIQKTSSVFELVFKFKLTSYFLWPNTLNAPYKWSQRKLHPSRHLFSRKARLSLIIKSLSTRVIRRVPLRSRNCLHVRNTCIFSTKHAFYQWSKSDFRLI